MTRRASPAVLILGTSHVGKSGLAQTLGAAAGWPVHGTDQLGRHPGRPWTGVPPAVIDFYLHLSAETIHWFLKVHHENLRPVIAATISQAGRRGAFLLEGAALRTEYLQGWGVRRDRVVCLCAEDDVLRDRIRRNSDYGSRSREVQRAIDAFIERSLRENAALVEGARRDGLTLLDVTGAPDIASVRARVVALLPFLPSVGRPAG
jgi:hypothetical protein